MSTETVVLDIREAAAAVTPDEIPDSPGGSKAIATLSFAQSIDFTEPQILNSMFPAVQAALKLADSSLGYLTAMKRSAEILSVLTWGFLADRFNRKSVLAASTLLGGIASVLTGLSPSLAPFFIFTMFINMGTSAMEGQTNSVLSDYYPLTRRGKAFGLMRGLAYAGLILSLISFSLLAKYLPANGWRIAYFIFGTLGISASLVIYFTLREPERGKTEVSFYGKAREIADELESGIVLPKTAALAAHGTFDFKLALSQFRIPTILVDALNLILLGFPKIMLVNYSVTFFVKIRHIPQNIAILITLMGLFGFISGSILGGIAGDRVGRKLGEKTRLIMGHFILAAMVLLSFVIFGIDLPVGFFMAVSFLTAFCIESLYSITRVAISSVLLPDVRTVGFAMSRVSDSFGSIIASLIYASVVAVSGIGNTVLYLSLGGGILALVQYTAYYFTVPADAEKMQETLRGMGAGI